VGRKFCGFDDFVQHDLERTVDLRVTNAPGGNIATELIKGAQRYEPAFLGIPKDPAKERPNLSGIGVEV
jgi:hypothetical protein